MHGGDPGHTQHSPLAQITPANVARLRVAWTYHTGDARPDNRSQIQCNPVVVDGVLYATSAGLKAFALDAATGPRAVAVRPLRRRGRGERARREPRRRRLGRRSRAPGPLQRRPVPVRARRAHREARARLREGRPRGPARGARARPRRPLRPLHDAGRRLPRPADPRHARPRGPGAVGARPRPRLRRAHRRHPVDVPHHPEAGRARPRDLAARGVEDGGRRQRVERDQRGPRAGARLPADRLAGVGLLGRRPARRRTCSATACSP